MTAIKSFSLLLPLQDCSCRTVWFRSAIVRVSGGVAALSRCGFRSVRYLEVKIKSVRECPLSEV